MPFMIPRHCILAIVPMIFLAVACTVSEPPLPTNDATVVAMAPGDMLAPSPAPGKPLISEVGVVVRVVDGDTIDVDIDGEVFRIRYIGVDTPETVHPTSGVEPFGPEASQFNKDMVDGQTVLLEKDISETDRFGRLLWYVFLDSRTMVNAALVEAGLARLSTFPPDVKYAELFIDLEQDAQASGSVLVWLFN